MAMTLVQVCQGRSEGKPLTNQTRPHLAGVGSAEKLGLVSIGRGVVVGAGSLEVVLGVEAAVLVLELEAAEAGARVVVVALGPCAGSDVPGVGGGVDTIAGRGEEGRNVLDIEGLASVGGDGDSILLNELACSVRSQASNQQDKQTGSTEVGVSVDTKGADGLGGSNHALGLGKCLASIVGVEVLDQTSNDDRALIRSNVSEDDTATKGCVERVPGHTTWAHQRRRT